jgi:type II secretory pathway pseudopilin PulG
LTLIEILLVLAILVAIGAIVTPVLTGAFARSQLRTGGEVVQSAWLRARMAAMETGHIHLFRYQLKTGEFQVVSLADLVATGGQTGLQQAPVAIEAEGPATIPRLNLQRLPSGVVFAAGEVAPSAHLTAMFSGLLNAQWAPPIVFHPDGTCTDAVVLLSNENQLSIPVVLRGVTGVARLGEIGGETTL